MLRRPLPSVDPLVASPPMIGALAAVFSTLLLPVKWAMEAVLVGVHALWVLVGLNGDDGLTWVLSILGLVVVVRAALLPALLHQVRTQRSMQLIAPRLRTIQERYRGKRDVASLEALRRETSAVHAEAGTRPLASLWSALVQIPVFLSLVQVLEAAARNGHVAGVGPLTLGLADSFGGAALLGAPLHGTVGSAFALVQAGSGGGAALALGVGLMVLMAVVQVLTQRRFVARNIPADVAARPLHRQQQALLTVLPLVVVVSGIAFPIGVLTYWVFSNLWTLAQQALVVRWAPTPGSPAAEARAARLERRASRRSG